MQQEIYKTIKEFSGQANLIVTPRIFIDYLNGDIFTALLLNQLIYWTDRTKNSWIYKTYSEWEKEIGINEYHIRKSSNILKNMELLKTKIKKVNGNPTVHYHLNIDNFSVSFLQFLKKRNFKISRKECSNFKGTSLYTETTTKTTPNNKEKILKKKFLDFVLLTEEEYQKLIDKFGDVETEEMIEKLNNYIGSKGKKYKSHYFTILNWKRMEQDKQYKKLSKKEENLKALKELYEEGEYEEARIS